jgi:AcrR family transcriptional regulator
VAASTSRSRTSAAKATKSSAAPARRRSKSTDISDNLLNAAIDILATDGTDAITVRTVATRAGVAPAGVYSRYDGKAGLIDALLVQGFELLHEHLVSVSGPNAIARLTAACLAYRDFALTHSHHYRLMFEHKSELGMSAKAQASAQVAFGELVSRVRDAMDAHKLARAEEIDVAQQIWSSLHGAVSLELRGIGFAADPAKNYSDLVGTVLKGLAL